MISIKLIKLITIIKIITKIIIEIIRKIQITVGIMLLEKEYKTRHNWFGKVTHRDFWKILKFDHTEKPESILENVMQKNSLEFWDAKTQQDVE